MLTFDMSCPFRAAAKTSGWALDFSAPQQEEG